MSLLFFALLLSAVAPVDSAASPSPSPAHQSLDDAWWTGPIIAPGAGTLPHGHLLFEPYFFDVIQYGAFDPHGTLQPATRTSTYGSLAYLLYGVTDRFTAGVQPVFGYTTPQGGPSSSHVALGDWAIIAQYRINLWRPDRRIPTASIALQENLPTGKYDNLGTNLSDGQGAGAYSTKVSLYTQSYFWMPNGRILRARLNFSDTFANGAVPVSGTSVYGTPPGFSGHAYPGNAFNVNPAIEYSITRNWVFAADLVYGYSATTRVTSASGTTSNSGDSHSLAFAPAIEYNWNGNVGIIGGFRWYPTGVNTSASLTPVIAINYVH